MWHRTSKYAELKRKAFGYLSAINSLQITEYLQESVRIMIEIWDTSSWLHHNLYNIKEHRDHIYTSYSCLCPMVEDKHNP